MTVEGIAAFRDRYTRKFPAELRRQVRIDLEKWADELVDLMKHRAPKKEHKLVNSIGWTWGDAPAGSFTIGTVGGREYATMRITVFAGNETTMVTNKRGIKFQNAWLQEVGTKNMPANPYFFNSHRKLKKRGKSRLTRGVTKVVKGFN